VSVLWIVAGDEVVEVSALERIFFEGEMFVSPQVVNPELETPVWLALHGFSASALRQKRWLSAPTNRSSRIRL